MEREVSTQSRVRVTPEEYLALERQAETKSDYFDGEMLQMPGVSLNHVTIVTNFVSELNSQFLDRPCRVLSTDLHVKIPRTGSYVYPDVIVVSGEPELEDDHQDTLLNPLVIFEVLSPSTESYDRGPKFAHYRTIESLQEYFLVSQTEVRIERYLRQDEGNWLYSEVTDPGASLELVSVACRIPVSRIYGKVDFEKAKRRA
jgi:Uma2 family endonuclease